MGDRAVNDGSEPVALRFVVVVEDCTGDEFWDRNGIGDDGSCANE